MEHDVVVTFAHATGSPSAYTTYPVIADPPVSVGATQVTTALESPAVTATLPGAPGTVTGTTATDFDEAGPVPTAFAALTTNVYEVPFVRRLTVQEVRLVEQLRFPGVEVTV